MQIFPSVAPPPDPLTVFGTKQTRWSTPYFVRILPNIHIYFANQLSMQNASSLRVRLPPLFEVELIINNAPLIYFYANTIETCLTSNYLLFGRQLL